ncbi:MAG: hypothetical protein LBM70_02880 [Victivallales bacterium]|nr:hypothetical protein [Victivallales bacterium]
MKMFYVMALWGALFLTVKGGFLAKPNPTGFPNVNVDTHLYLIAKHYFPDTAVSKSDSDLEAMVRNWTIEFHDRMPKSWRYINEMDYLNPIWARGDSFFAGRDMHPLLFKIYLANEAQLNEMCKASPAVRDFIIGVGLTNRVTRDARRVAYELVQDSPINAPVWALRLTYEKAKKLLVSMPEHRQLLDLLTIHHLRSKKQYDEVLSAIDRYIATYPDYTHEDMQKTSIAMNTHAELNGIAAGVLFEQGKYREALARFLYGGTPEDIAIIAEQVMTIDELKNFCDSHSFKKQIIMVEHYSHNCDKETQISYPDMLDHDVALAIIRNILARRLMRERRYNEAMPYFTGEDIRYLAERFNALWNIAVNPNSSKSKKFKSRLLVADMLRRYGDVLVGTELEPDNFICKGRFKCSWGGVITSVKLNKPDLPRFHYRYQAAEIYREAASFANDIRLTAFCDWSAGRLTKALDPNFAERYFKRLANLSCPLGKQAYKMNWFPSPKTFQKLDPEVFQLTKLQLLSLEEGTPKNWRFPLPIIPQIDDLPVTSETPEAYMKFTTQFAKETTPDHSSEVFYILAYAWQKAGAGGIAQGYYNWGEMEYRNKSFYRAAALYQKACSMDPGNKRFQHALQLAYHQLGVTGDAYDFIQEPPPTSSDTLHEAK